MRAMREHVGFKELTVDNWCQPDPAGGAFGEVSLATGEQRAMTGERWAEQFLAVELKPQVPIEVRELWEVARGVLLYGWFFYPLYMVGEEQLRRVADAAVLHRYRQLQGPPGPRSGEPPNFNRRLRWLFDHGYMPARLEQRWQAIRQLRNLGSHAEFQGLQMPGGALSTLHLVTEEINGLFVEAVAGI